MDNDDTGPSREYILLKEEVDSIQVALMKAHKPWYKEVSSLVAISALVLSVFSTFINLNHQAETNLREHLKELVNLPKENLEIMQEYSDDPNMAAFLSGHINQRNQMIVQLAINEIERIEGNLLATSAILPVEYVTVASALANAYDLDRAKLYYRKAISASDDMNTSVGAIRAVANIDLNSGNIEKFREAMKLALEMSGSEQYSNSTKELVDITNAYTEIQWAFGEVQLGECNSAKVHYFKAKDLIDDFGANPLHQPIKLQLEQFNQYSGCK